MSAKQAGINEIHISRCWEDGKAKFNCNTLDPYITPRHTIRTICMGSHSVATALINMHLCTSHTQLHHPLAMPTIIYQIMLGWKDALKLSVAYGNFEIKEK